MDSTSNHPQTEIIDEVYGYITIYSDGTVERPPFPGGYLSACSSFVRGIASKDVNIDTRSGLWARIFLPECAVSSQRKVPVVLHFHGGGLCAGSPAVASFHRFCSKMAIESESIWVSVDHRLAPEHRLPAAYDDALSSFMWLCSQAEMQAHEKTVASISTNDNTGCSHTHDEYMKKLGSFPKHGTSGHQSVVPGHVSISHTHKKAEYHESSFGHDINGHNGFAHDGYNTMQASCEEWLCCYADFSRCFLAGESSGGAIVHFLTMRLTQTEYSCVEVKGLLLIHSAFLVEGLYDTSLNPRFERRPDTYRWLCLPIGAQGNHPLVNPLHAEAPSFKDIVWPPSIVCVADQDRFYEPGLRYVQVMKQHGHAVELHITNEEVHCFYLYRPKSKKAKLFYEHLAAFMHRQCELPQTRSLL